MAVVAEYDYRRTERLNNYSGRNDSEAISAGPACTTRTSGFGYALAGSCSLVLRKLAAPPALLATLALVPKAQDPIAGILSVTEMNLETKRCDKQKTEDLTRTFP